MEKDQIKPETTYLVQSRVSRAVFYVMTVATTATPLATHWNEDDVAGYTDFYGIPNEYVSIPARRFVMEVEDVE